MALVVGEKMRCLLCGQSLGSEQITAFPAFLPPNHELCSFSDAAFHRACFERDARSAAVSILFARYRSIWDSRPSGLQSVEEIDSWGREAFKNFP